MATTTSSTGEFETEGGVCYSGMTLKGLYQHLFRSKDHDSGWHSATTAEEVCSGWDGRGKVVLVTGASTGLGLESARVLAARGADVICGVRDMAKAQRAADVIRQSHPGAALTLLPLDLASLASVRAFAREFLALGKPLNALLLNAGIAAAPFKASAEGYESQFATNHLGHFLLSALLLPVLLDTSRQPGAPEGRVVVVSSVAHAIFWPGPGLDLDMLTSAEKHRAWPAYGRSKLCNVLFARQLQERLKGEPVSVVSCHPGTIKTEILRFWPKGLTTAVILGVTGPFMKSIPQGTATQVYLTTAQSAKRGEYYADCRVTPTSKLALSKKLAQELWDFSEEACKPFLLE